MTLLEPGDRFPKVRVETLTGPEDLEERWQQAPLVVVFMRHFGCAFCREHLIRLGRSYDEIRSAGADVVAVFQYGAEPVERFCRSRGVPFACVGDPEREAYGQVALQRGKRKQLLSFRVARNLPRASRAGVGLGLAGRSHGGDMAQLPGTFVVDTAGRLVLAHYNADSSDNPSPERVLDAVRAAAG